MTDRVGATMNRRGTLRYWPRWVALAWAVVGLLALIGTGACRRGVPAIDTSPRPSEADGTLRGTVRGPEGTTAVEGRIVEVINVDTGERRREATDSAGGFSFKLKPGHYRLVLTLQEGEALSKQPGTVTLDDSDVDAHADFVLGNPRVSRPRSPSYRPYDGLGAAIA
jgi:hypothetical protein